MGLNSQQRKAATTLEGQVCVISCPGSGKTTTIVERTRNLLKSGVSPENIIVITFTKSSADDMKARFLSAGGNEKVFFGTIHGMCFLILKNSFGYRNEDILKESEKWSFFWNLYSEDRPSEASDMSAFIGDMIGEISYVVNKGINPKAYVPEHSTNAVFQRSFQKYQEYKEEVKKIDFDDMLTVVLNGLRKNPEILKFWKEKWQYLEVDEFQDTNSIQESIFELLAGDDGNICVVFDDDQSIYRFRAADPSISLNFPKRYPKATVITMDTNYRSCPEIVKAASNLITHNTLRYKKELKAFRKEEGCVTNVCYKSTGEEAAAVIAKIETLHATGVPYEEMAILYRNNSQSTLLIQRLLKQKIPFHTNERPRDIHSEVMFCDYMAYGRLVGKNEKKGDLQRILNRPTRYLKSDLFNKCDFNMTQMLDCCLRANNSQGAKNGVYTLFSDIRELRMQSSLQQQLNFLNNHMGYRVWLKSYADFIGRDSNELFEFLSILMEESKDFSTFEEWEEYAKQYSFLLNKASRKENGGVILSTFHGSKGLEWQYVFIIGANEDITPYYKAETQEEIEEERRMFYVALTRAKEVAFISYTNGSNNKKLLPSIFIDEIKKEA